MAELKRREANKAAMVRALNQTRKAEFKDEDISKLQLRLKMLKDTYVRYHDAHMEVIEQINDEDVDGIRVQDEAAEAADETYIEAAAAISIRISELSQPDDGDNDGNGQSDNGADNRRVPLRRHNDFQLERIKVPIFSGEQSDWSEWKAIYESLVHHNEDIDKTEKFQHLKRVVSGSAEGILKGWYAVGDHYDDAYEAVVSVYENKYRLIMAHLSIKN